MTIASMDFFTVLSRFDVTTLTKRLHAKPELYFTLINSYANLMRANLEREKFDFKRKPAEARQREREQKLRARKPILLTRTTFDHLHRTFFCSRRRDEADPGPQFLPAAPSATQRPSCSTANSGATHVFECTTRTPAGASDMPDPPPLTTQEENAWAAESLDNLVRSPS